MGGKRGYVLSMRFRYSILLGKGGVGIRAGGESIILGLGDSVFSGSLVMCLRRNFG